MEIYRWLCLLVVISGCHSLDSTPITTTEFTDWNGDPSLCTVDPLATPSPIPSKPLPKFSRKAEFAIESIQKEYQDGSESLMSTSFLEYIYDYDANKLIMIKNQDGFISRDYFFYEILKKSSYMSENFCAVSSISTENNSDGTSAIKLPNGQWHIRPFNEFILFSSDDPARKLIPVYLGSDTVRGIPVDKWQTCLVDKTMLTTRQYVWTFAQQNFLLPGKSNDNYSIPIQGTVKASYLLPNFSQAIELDAIFNVYSYTPGILEDSTQLAPPKGVFCDSGPDQNLISLEDIGIAWPNQFGVRVETSTSRSSSWQHFRLRYDQGQNGIVKRLRYDYLPSGVENYQSVIHNYFDNLTYTIDRATGSCQITHGIDIPVVNPILDSTRFFIKNEAKFILSSQEKIWEFTGFRKCRGNSIVCATVIASIEGFPEVFDPDTGIPTGETWGATNIEYAWSKRASMSTPSPDGRLYFDYPASLSLKMLRFQDPNNPSAFNIITEDIVYEFYEMSIDSLASDFDTSICDRSLDRSYLHLGFVLRPMNNTHIDAKYVNRYVLERKIRDYIVSEVQVSMQRISDIQVDHIRFDNSYYVLFTLLGPLPFSSTDEPTVNQAEEGLEVQINAGLFVFDMTLLDEEKTNVQFMAEPESLKVSKQFMSIHASWVHANVSNCNSSNTNTSSSTLPTTQTSIVSTHTLPTTTTKLNTDVATSEPLTSTQISSTEFPVTTTTDIKPTTTSTSHCQNVNGSHSNRTPIRKEKYTTSSQVGGILGGLIVGVVLGFVLFLLNQVLTRKASSDNSSLISGGLLNISFRNNKSLPPVSMQSLQNASSDT